MIPTPIFLTHIFLIFSQLTLPFHPKHPPSPQRCITHKFPNHFSGRLCVQELPTAVKNMPKYLSIFFSHKAWLLSLRFAGRTTTCFFHSTAVSWQICSSLFTSFIEAYEVNKNRDMFLAYILALTLQSTQIQ